MKTYLYHLEFPLGAHFGRQGIGLEETQESLPSDSLTSALLNAFALMGEVSEALMALQEENPPFVLSSLFPYGPDPNNGARRLYALPRPMTSPLMTKTEDLQRAGKELKKIRYLDPRHVLSWLGNRPMTSEALEEIQKSARRLARPWNADTGEGWFSTCLRPRVALDRSSQNSVLWWCGVIHFRPGAGLYGLVRFRDESWKSRLHAAFALLEDMGLGGERTYGLGTFRFHGFVPLEEAWPNVPVTHESAQFVLLSRYAPAAHEVPELSAVLKAWDFEESRGFVVTGRYATTLKRKRVHFLKEGTVATRSLLGRLVDVTPDQGPDLGLSHRVYRSGMGFWFP
ncbi:type III-A CRISPR-associated RAMP protein Csm4 [Desulfosoma caldarium]|uniref:CRISPR system Cms protein Csm4 n=1 Tax=Desulfosoma caldarium TaxID=610254 RepID=A0A3N1UXQ7_9BACT|nr:type III-A CRISPR-associated RAMP protein Csm4 [Desulfosoma caldarium]ROQ92046.1 CRISPR-associated Csm4 family protein [Desulfosoma caldarium]